MKPVIGITTATNGKQYQLRYEYVEAIARCGGIPLILSYDVDSAGKVLSMLDGLLLTGGGDISGPFLHEPVHPKANTIYYERDRVEVALSLAAVERRLPVLGICRGMQIFNIALGGTICQHVENHMQQEAREVATHAVWITPDTLFSGIVGKGELPVNSLHHQVVAKPGQGLAVCALSSDGLVEGICSKEGLPFMVGVQWHPESLYPEDIRQKNIFEAFITACNR